MYMSLSRTNYFKINFSKRSFYPFSLTSRESTLTLLKLNQTQHSEVYKLVVIHTQKMQSRGPARVNSDKRHGPKSSDSA